MTAEEAKEIADEINKDNIEKADADFDHVEIEILNSAKNGEYSVAYSFDPSRDFSLVNEIRNRLLEAGFDVEFGEGPISKGYSLEIHWATNH